MDHWTVYRVIPHNNKLTPAELAETKAELQRLRERVSVGTHTVHKDLSLISLIPKWSGAETGFPLEEFLSVIESSVRIGLWKDRDKLQIAALRLTDVARQFYNGCLELHSPDETWRGERATARKRSAIWRHAAVTGQRPQQTGMNKRKLRLDVMNARDSDTSQRSVQHD